jgi:hypothetical protein
MDATSNQQISSDQGAPATFSHPRGYINENGDYAIWVGTPPGIDPGQIHQETVTTSAALTPEHE